MSLPHHILSSKCIPSGSERHNFTCANGHYKGLYYLGSLDESNFIKEYENETLKNGKFIDYGLIQEQERGQLKPLLIDYDLHLEVDDSYTGECRNLSGELIDEISSSIFEILLQTYGKKTIESLYMYIMCRPTSEFETKFNKLVNKDKRNIKDGIHIIVPGIIVADDTASNIYAQLRRRHEKCDKFSKYKGQPDNAIAKSTKWPMYGCSKKADGKNTYLVSLSISLDGQYNKKTTFTMEDHVSFIRKFCVHGYDKSCETTRLCGGLTNIIDINSIKLVEEANVEEHENERFDEKDIEFYDLVLNNISSDRFGPGDDWRNIGWCLAGASDKDSRFYKLFYKYAVQYHLPDHIKALWDQSRDNLNSDKSTYTSFNKLFSFLKEDVDDIKYNEIMNKKISVRIQKHIGAWHDFDIAEILVALIGDDCRTNVMEKKIELYMYRKGIWKRQKNDGKITKYITNNLSKIFMDTYCRIVDYYRHRKVDPIIDSSKIPEKCLPHILKAYEKTRNVSSVEHICDAFKLCPPVCDDKFIKSLDLKRHIISFRSCNPEGLCHNVYDFKASKSRFSRKDDYLTKRLPSFYYDYTMENIKKWTDYYWARKAELEKTEEGRDSTEYDKLAKYNLELLNEKMLKFINDVLPIQDEREYLIKIFARSLVGGSNPEEIYILIGKGANAKTTLLEKLFAASFGKDYHKTVDQSVFTSKANTDPSKPEAYWQAFDRTRVITSAEPPVGSTFNTNVIKSISGDEPKSFRIPYASENKVINPECNIYMSVNDIPKLDMSQFAIYRRMYFIELKATFVVKGAKAPPQAIKEYIKEANLSIKDDLKLIVASGLFISYLVHIYNTQVKDKSIPVPPSIQKYKDDFTDKTDMPKKFIESIQFDGENSNSIIQADKMLNEYRNFRKARNAPYQYNQDDFWNRLKMDFNEKYFAEGNALRCHSFKISIGNGIIMPDIELVNNENKNIGVVPQNIPNTK